MVQIFGRLGRQDEIAGEKPDLASSTPKLTSSRTSWTSSYLSAHLSMAESNSEEPADWIRST